MRKTDASSRAASLSRVSASNIAVTQGRAPFHLAGKPGWRQAGQSLEYEKELSVPHISVRWIRVLHEATLHVELVHIKHWNGVYDAIAEVQFVIAGLGNLWRFGCRCSTKSR